MAQLTKQQRKREWLFCDLCGRLTFSDQPEVQWWLVGSDYGTNVIRCPQHISEWSLRISGRGRTKESYRWMRLAKMNDKYDPLLELIEPVLLQSKEV
jgi:hypothetical protein